MNENNTILTCPLGSECERIANGKIERCRWFITLAGQNPKTGEQMDSEECALSAIPILLVQQSRATESMGAAVESHRNVMTSRADVANQVLNSIANKRLS